MTLELSDFRPGDLLIITERSLRGEERRAAVVTFVNYRGCGLVTYAGRSHQGLLPTGQGAFDPAKVGTTPYGFHCAIEKVGHESPREPREPWSPKPGDRGYDLMC